MTSGTLDSLFRMGHQSRHIDGKESMPRCGGRGILGRMKRERGECWERRLEGPGQRVGSARPNAASRVMGRSLNLSPDTMGSLSNTPASPPSWHRLPGAGPGPQPPATLCHQILVHSWIFINIVCIKDFTFWIQSENSIRAPHFLVIYFKIIKSKGVWIILPCIAQTQEGPQHFLECQQNMHGLKNLYPSCRHVVPVESS